jgi:hypothetical protein
LPSLVQAFTCRENPGNGELTAGLCQYEATDVKLTIKALVTAALLWLLFRSVDVGAVWALLAGIALAGVGLALVLAGLLVLADAVAVRRKHAHPWTGRAAFGLAALHPGGLVLQQRGPFDHRRGPVPRRADVAPGDAGARRCARWS